MDGIVYRILANSYKVDPRDGILRLIVEIPGLGIPKVIQEERVTIAHGQWKEIRFVRGIDDA
jgi:hypothetical protein